ncbi:MAG: hypothetical protein JNK25_09270 [Phycisphaerae bacterium]|nr:hypothetical protein [Phycisphaerae bacterium]
MLLMAIGLVSCGPAKLAVDPGITGDPPGLTVRADWNDVNAAAQVAGARVELAMLSLGNGPTEDGRAERRFVFLATDDTEFDLRARQAEPGAGKVIPGPIVLNAQARPKRDRDRESRLLSAMADRLRDLAGKEWAPLDD